MVRLKGPSLSLAARGALGKALIFSEGPRGAYAKKWHEPANPNTAGQVAMRAVVRLFSESWATLPDSDKLTWTAHALDTRVSELNAAIAYNLERWRRFQNPTIAFPPDLGHLYQQWTPWNVAVHGRRVDHTLHLVNLRDGACWAMFRGTVGSFTLAWNNLVDFIGCYPLQTDYEWTDFPGPGAWYYRCYAIADDASPGPILQRGPFTVT